jgi:hypothetical protein
LYDLVKIVVFLYLVVTKSVYQKKVEQHHHGVHNNSLDNSQLISNYGVGKYSFDDYPNFGVNVIVSLIVDLDVFIKTRKI